jgi:hypothetical protein
MPGSKKQGENFKFLTLNQDLQNEASEKCVNLHNLL